MAALIFRAAIVWISLDISLLQCLIFVDFVKLTTLVDKKFSRLKTICNFPLSTNNRFFFFFLDETPSVAPALSSDLRGYFYYLKSQW